MLVLAPLGAGYPIQKATFSSRDQVGCWRSLPDGLGNTQATARLAGDSLGALSKPSGRLLKQPT